MSLRNTRTRFQRILDLTDADDCCDDNVEAQVSHSSAFSITSSSVSPMDSPAIGEIYADDETALNQLVAESSCSVEEELGDLGALTVQQLRSLRKRYARHNHPDLASNCNAKAQTDRMSIANQLIDEALLQIKRRKQIQC